jgi:hypothetical protein
MWLALIPVGPTLREAQTATCPARPPCTRRQFEPRELVLQPRVEHEALRLARRQT